MQLDTGRDGGSGGPTLPQGPFGAPNLMRLRRSEARALSDFIRDEPSLRAVEDAFRSQLARIPEADEALVEDLYAAGLHLRKVFDERAEPDLEFRFPRGELDERVWLIFVAGFLRYSYDIACLMQSAPRSEFPAILERADAERRATRGAATPSQDPPWHDEEAGEPDSEAPVEGEQGPAEDPDDPFRALRR